MRYVRANSESSHDGVFRRRVDDGVFFYVHLVFHGVFKSTGVGYLVVVVVVTKTAQGKIAVQFSRAFFLSFFLLEDGIRILVD